MILCVGDSVKLGHLREALEQRLHQEVTFLPAAPDIRRQENDILLAAQGTDAIIYDTDAYYNDGEELIGVIQRIWRTNHAAPILLVPTDNLKNDRQGSAGRADQKIINGPYRRESRKTSWRRSSPATTQPTETGRTSVRLRTRWRRIPGRLPPL